MTWIGILFLLIVASVLETALGGPWAGGHLGLDLSSGAVVFAALYRGRRAGAVAGFLAGILNDLSEPVQLGRSSLVFMAAGFLAGLVGEKTVRENAVTQFVLVTLMVLARQAVRLAASSPASPGESVAVLSSYALPAALTSAAVAVALFRLFARMSGSAFR